MQRKNLFKISMFVVAVLALSAVASAQVPLLPNYPQTATITLPGGLFTFDIGWVDSASQRYYLTDRGPLPKAGAKSTGRIDVVDTQQNKLLYTIPTSAAEIGFTGPTP